MTERGRAIVDALLAGDLYGHTPGAPQLLFTGGLQGVESAVLDDDEPGDRDNPYVEGQLAAFEALGLLTPDECAAWERRFSLVERGWRVGRPRSDEQRAAASDHLGRLLERLAASAPTDRMAVIANIRGALVLLICAGMVSEEDLPAWDRRIELLSEAVPDPWDEAAPWAPDEGLDPELDLATTGVHAVYPARPVVRHDGLCVTSVAAHAAGLTIYWHLVWEGDLVMESPHRFGYLELADDVGTEYGGAKPGTFGYSSGGEMPVAVIGESSCGGSVPPEASELRVTRGAATWTVSLGR